METTSEVWSSRNHEVVTGRSRKGARQDRVVRFGQAAVHGAIDTDSHGAPLLAYTDSLDESPNMAAARELAILVERGEVRRLRVGLSALDILDVTERTYAALGLIEPLLSTDVRQHAQVIRGDRSSYCPVAYRTGSLTDAYNDAPLSEMARALVVAPERAYASHTKLPWGARVRLRSVRVRKSETAMIQPGELVASSGDPDTMFVGHRLVKRGKVAHVARRQARHERTIGQVDTIPTSSEAWAELLAMLNRGERITLPGVTITRGKDGRYSAVDRRDIAARWQTRTATALAERLA